MRLIALEIKKLIGSWALAAFVVLCLAFNVFLVLNNGTDDYAQYVASASTKTGVTVDSGFSETLAALPKSDQQQRLLAETAGLTNVFNNYDTAQIAEAYIGALALDGRIAEDMHDKYAALQGELDKKAERADGMALYFAGGTYAQHQKLFGSVMPTLCIEGIFLSVLVMLFALGYENVSKTEQIVYSSKAGRRVALKKLAAAVAVGMGACLLLVTITLALHLALNDYGDVWGSNVSSGFNGIEDHAFGGFRPFATWHSFTVLSYLLATLGVSLCIMLCLSLAGFVAGTTIRNSYIGFLALLVACIFCITLPMLLPNGSFAKFACMLTPIWLWLKQSLWFTDGGIDILWSNFETRGVCLSLVILAALATVATLRFRKKEIA
jgi:hypothetical protein